MTIGEGARRKELFMKRFYDPHFKDMLFTLGNFGRICSQGQCEWNNANLLLQNGIETYKPICCGWESACGFEKRSFFITEKIDGICLADFVTRLSDIGRKHDLPIPSFGHAGDGNIHVNIMFNRDDKHEAVKADKALKEILKLVIELKGTISGEHGVGISKKPYIGMEIPQIGLELMSRIKSAFDPNGILNPGKIFDVNQKNSLLQ